MCVCVCVCVCVCARARRGNTTAHNCTMEAKDRPPRTIRHQLNGTQHATAACTKQSLQTRKRQNKGRTEHDTSAEGGTNSSAAAPNSEPEMNRFKTWSRCRFPIFNRNHSCRSLVTVALLPTAQRRSQPGSRPRTTMDWNNLEQEIVARR